MSPSISSSDPAVNAGPINDRPPDPCDLFRQLVDARRRGDRTNLRALLADLRRSGWTIFATAQTGQGRGQ